MRQKFNTAHAQQSPDIDTSAELNLQLAMRAWNQPEFICIKRGVLPLDLLIIFDAWVSCMAAHCRPKHFPSTSGAFFEFQMADSEIELFET